MRDNSQNMEDLLEQAKSTKQVKIIDGMTSVMIQRWQEQLVAISEEVATSRKDRQLVQRSIVKQMDQMRAQIHEAC